ncbi:hypothetical protein K6754_23825 [Vibrio alginolyticus]|uniref:hypothetical protein n=1 Tax=Vibrio alginolyticus TaxID=663 RepID=UPI001EF0DFCF|nr:hypothetical protein [Vibrio alginolyticus]EMC8460728.1 hypothetical protein [Vibrio alginolyticus]EME3934705.1 hypothetical protein [Vibrio alginolyticus]ULF93923.1 hypothetical protein K6754_23825 [Vibrio alginolyticus]
MSIKHRYIINQTNNKAYSLGGLSFKTNTVFTRFSHDELSQLPEQVQACIKKDLLPTDILLLDTLTLGRERALYEVVEL